MADSPIIIVSKGIKVFDYQEVAPVHFWIKRYIVKYNISNMCCATPLGRCFTRCTLYLQERIEAMADENYDTILRTAAALAASTGPLAISPVPEVDLVFIATIWSAMMAAIAEEAGCYELNAEV